MPIRRLVCAVLLGTGVAPMSAAAQATRDEARLVLGVSLGWVNGADLWAVSPQAVQFTTPTDSFGISRRIRSNLVVGFGGTYFPSENLGIAVEGFLIGLGFEDNCRHVFSSGSGDVAAVCTSLQGREKPASAVTLSAGPVWRFNSRKALLSLRPPQPGRYAQQSERDKNPGRVPDRFRPVDPRGVQ